MLKTNKMISAILTMGVLSFTLSGSVPKTQDDSKFEIHSTDPTALLLASGKWLYLWRKESDRWRIALEMDNFNSPKTKKPAPR